MDSLDPGLLLSYAEDFVSVLGIGSVLSVGVHNELESFIDSLD